MAEEKTILTVDLYDNVLTEKAGDYTGKIRITGTNDAGIALFETTDGKVSGEIHYTEPEGDSEFYHKINGITEDQYFESIPYAG